MTSRACRAMLWPGLAAAEPEVAGVGLQQPDEVDKEGDDGGEQGAAGEGRDQQRDAGEDGGLERIAERADLDAPGAPWPVDFGAVDGVGLRRASRPGSASRILFLITPVARYSAPPVISRSIRSSETAISAITPSNLPTR